MMKASRKGSFSKEAQVTEKEAVKRGREDASKDYPPIFRYTSRGIEANGDDDAADDWTSEVRKAYLEGYYNRR
jgi:hypothetical protein